ncbi:MAG: ATP-binding protein [Litoreibacter sp.]|nr:ATP-binding protein [Litoreibacter sp.]MCY4335145.1 ATP-binding protein [Litoreibacter sp.]
MAGLPIKRLLPRGLYGRAALILLVPIVTIQLVVSFSFIQRLYEDVTVQMTQNMVPQLRYLLKTAEIQSSEIEAQATELGIGAKWAESAMISRIRFYDLSGRAIRDTLVDNVPGVRAVDLVQDRKWVFLSLESGAGPLELSFPRSRVSARNPHQLLVLMLATGILMTVIAFVFLRNQLRPIKRLADAADAFGKGQVVPYHPTGANEVRSAGSAFLNMRSRIERQTQQRTMMLSGVSHDLRTPLTRMKLGLSMQEATPETEALLNDVSDMESLISAFLDFARADATEELEMADPSALVRDIVEKAKRDGRKVALGVLPEGSIEMRFRPLALQRALDNLAGNATRYGTNATVSLDVLESSVRFRVEDDGPGIPEDMRDEALKPFARLDAARNQNKGSGVGLGLAIAADIARSHGGVLRLGESETLGGLSAELVLPR